MSANPNNPIKAIRGMNDLLPEHSYYWQTIEQQLRTLVQQYGYHEIRFPVLEQTRLFKRSVGEHTDIVEKEMYSFDDRNGDNLSLRPEGTACCVRAALEHGLLYNQTQKLWYLGPFYRHERPQKGRYRQFHQLGVEAFGIATPDIDAEIIALTANLFKQLGLGNSVSLQLNSIGSLAARKNHTQTLISYFSQHQAQLDQDSLKRLNTNPLRILDSKNPDLQPLIQAAPKMLEFLDEPSRQHFEQVQAYLDSMGIAYTINPTIVRGLDYYNDTVFEWVTDQLGAQATVCAGGRYNGLVEQLGGKATPAIGFGMGVERLILLLQAQENFSQAQTQQTPDAYFIISGDAARAQALAISEQIRQRYPGIVLTVHLGTGSLKSQFKKADKSGAPIALVLGDDELAQNKLTVKFLRGQEAQRLISLEDLGAIITKS